MHSTICSYVGLLYTHGIIILKHGIKAEYHFQSDCSKLHILARALKNVVLYICHILHVPIVTGCQNMCM